MTLSVSTKLGAAVVEVEIPVRIESELNDNGRHYAVRKRRFDAHKKATHYMLIASRSILKMITAGEAGIIVTLTRFAPRLLDAHDNLRSGFKGVADQIATELGLDDKDPRIEWIYRQAKASKYSAQIRIEQTEEVVMKK